MNAILHLQWVDVDLDSRIIVWRAPWDKTGREYIQVRPDHLKEAPSVMDRDLPDRPQTVPEPGGAADRGLELVGTGGLRNSRGGTRTPDPPVNSRLLYQLSYSGMSAAQISL